MDLIFDLGDSLGSIDAWRIKIKVLAVIMRYLLRAFVSEENSTRNSAEISHISEGTNYKPIVKPILPKGWITKNFANF